MADQKLWIKRLVTELAEKLSEKYVIDKVILFGSYAWGKPSRHSDLDLAVISKSFDGIDDITRIIELTDVARSLKTSRPIGIDLIGFTPEELAKADYFDLAGEIKEKGKVIFNKAA